MKETEQITIQEYLKSLNQEKQVITVTPEELIDLLEEVTPEEVVLSEELEDEPSDGEIHYTTN